MFGRAFTEMAGVALMSRGFWAAVLLLAGVAWLIDNPRILLIGVGGVVCLIVAVLVISKRQETAAARAPLLTVNGQQVSLSKFQCRGCGVVGRLRLEQAGGPPTVYCPICRHREVVPQRIA